MTGFAIQSPASQSQLDTLAAAVPQYVGDTRDNPTTYEALFAAFPPSAALRGRIAKVTNYGGSYDQTMRCDYESVSNAYYWRPTGTPRSSQDVVVNANMTLDPIITGDIVRLTGTIGLGITRTVTLSTTRGYPGDMKTIKNDLSSLLGGLNILGLGLGSGIASLIGATTTYQCRWNGSALEWVRLT